MKAKITGVSGYVPPDVLTNLDLEKMVETNDEWILSRTGIKQRHILKDPTKATSDLAVEAVNELLVKTNTDPSEIDFIVCGTVTPDMTFPDTANTIADKIGAVNSFGFDINAACSGFLYALSTGAKFVESGKYKKVIVIGADQMSSIIDYTDRATCIIFGDGAGAVLLEPSDSEYGIIDEVLGSDGSGREYLHKKAGGSLLPSFLPEATMDKHYVYQEGRTVFKFAVKRMSECVLELMKRNNLTKDDVKWLVPHQANIRIINAVADHAGFPLEKVMVTIENYGNTTAATLPLCLNDYEGRLKKGDKVILTSFGGGFTWGATYLKWAYD